MWSEWDPDPANILESDKVTFFTLNYIIVISKLDAAWHCHLQGGRLFSGGKFTDVSARRADLRRDFQHKHFVS